MSKKKTDGFGIETVAQIYRRPDGKFTFRWQEGTRYRYARELAGNDLGWLTLFAAERAARGFGIKNVVQIDDR